VQTGSRAHPVPYSMTTSVSSVGVKGTWCEADSCLIISCWGLEWVELNLHSPEQAFKGCTKTLLLFLHFNIIISFMLTAHTNLFIWNILTPHMLHYPLISSLLTVLTLI